MIRNMVFDMGGVLFSYNPPAFVRKYCQNPDDAELINRELFGAPEWEQMDRGTMTDQAYLATVLPRIPEHLRTVAVYLFEHWHEMPRPFPEMERLIHALKESRYRIYLLSNMSTRFYRFYQNIPAMRWFDGMIVSSDVHLLKPEPEIYCCLFRRFGLVPEECFFLDDRLENVRAGEELGIKGFLFQRDYSALADAFHAAGIVFNKNIADFGKI